MGTQESPVTTCLHTCSSTIVTQWSTGTPPVCHIKMEASRWLPCPRTQQASLPACSPHYPFFKADALNHYTIAPVNSADTDRTYKISLHKSCLCLLVWTCYEATLQDKRRVWDIAMCYFDRCFEAKAWAWGVTMIFLGIAARNVTLWALNSQSFKQKSVNAQFTQCHIFDKYFWQKPIVTHSRQIPSSSEMNSRTSNKIQPS